MSEKKPEVWLRGPVAGVPPELQPVAHALLQAREEVAAMLHDFPDSLLWVQPAGLASVAFHLQHLVGVLDRLFAYARGQALSPDQLAWLAEEGRADPAIETARLVQDFERRVDEAVQELATIDPDTLQDRREVGRKRLPSTRAGLLFHAAEHTQRHVGQLLVTARIVADRADDSSE